VTLDQAIERIYALKVDTTTRDGDGTPHEKPHKPLLLLAAFDLIDEGLATPDRIPWCQALRDRFTARFELVRKLNDRNNPDLPFRYLAGDDLWIALEADGRTPVRREIRVSDIGQVFARFTNGLALCKNHHWAMDRDIIAPGPDLHWHVSKILDPRRSNGERELHELAGKSVLLPKDPAFHPMAEGLEWRLRKLTA
jgi:predicted restriction endonuclease